MFFSLLEIYRYTEVGYRIYPAVDHFLKVPSYSLGLYLLIGVYDSINSSLIMQRGPEGNEMEPGSVTNVGTPPHSESHKNI
jgi:hypothetical protein